MLIEAIVSIVILLTGFVATTSLAAQALRVSSLVSNRFIASKLAEEGLEVVRNMVVTNSMLAPVDRRPFNVFPLSTGPTVTDGVFRVAGSSTQFEPCATPNCADDVLLLDSQGTYSYASPGSTTIFRRRIELKTISPNEIRVNSIVLWRELGGDAQVNAEVHFFNWR
jgi:hypothetical protein